MICLLLAGEIGCGKTTVANLLAGNLGGTSVRIRQALADVLGVSASDRDALQREGRDLDQRTNGRWLCEYLVEHAGSRQEPVVVVDAMRTERQTLPVLDLVPHSHLVYLEASETVRRRRFELAAINDPVKRSMPFDRAIQHSTEREVVRLRVAADLVVETDDMTAADVCAEITSAIQNW